MVGEAGIQTTFTPPICAICGKEYDDDAMQKNPFDENNHFYGTWMETNKKNWRGKKKRIEVELCHHCMVVVEKIRKGVQYD